MSYDECVTTLDDDGRFNVDYYGSEFRIVDVRPRDGSEDTCGDMLPTFPPDPPFDDDDFEYDIPFETLDEDGNPNGIENIPVVFPREIPPSLSLEVNLGGIVFNVDTGGLTVGTPSPSGQPAPGSGSGGSGGSGSGGGDCAGLSAAFEDRIEEVLRAIAELRTKVVEVEEFVNLEVVGETYTDLECPKEEEGEGADDAVEAEIGTVTEYEGKGLSVLFDLVEILNDNLISTFEALCEAETSIALPAWWQVRLGANVPQIVCVFRKGATSTYHSISIPHPANTGKAKGELLPTYMKGNWMGMVTCSDNSKFIINCASQTEAERMCNVAIALIDPSFLESPPRVYVGQRKGQGVGVDSMNPTSIEYYSKGQQNTIPDWRVRLSKLEE